MAAILSMCVSPSSRPLASTSPSRCVTSLACSAIGGTSCACLDDREADPAGAVRSGTVRHADACWLAPLVLYDGSVEARWSGVPLFEALRDARHSGPPDRRATYHESLP